MGPRRAAALHVDPPIAATDAQGLCMAEAENRFDVRLLRPVGATNDAVDELAAVLAPIIDQDSRNLGRNLRAGSFLAADGVSQREAEDLVAVLESLGARARIERADHGSGSDAVFAERRLFDGSEGAGVEGAWGSVVAQQAPPPRVFEGPPPRDQAPAGPDEALAFSDLDPMSSGSFPPTDPPAGPEVSAPPPQVWRPSPGPMRAAAPRPRALVAPPRANQGSLDDMGRAHTIDQPFPDSMDPVGALGSTGSVNEEPDTAIDFATYDTLPVGAEPVSSGPSQAAPPKVSPSGKGRASVTAAPRTWTPPKASDPEPTPLGSGQWQMRRPSPVGASLSASPGRPTASSRSAAPEVDAANRSTNRMIVISAVIMVALIVAIALTRSPSTTEQPDAASRSAGAIAPDPAAQPPDPDLAAAPDEADAASRRPPLEETLSVDELLAKGRLACANQMYDDCERMLYEVMRRDPSRREVYDLLVQISQRKKKRQRR